jgi:hypothetical protein
MANHQKTTLSDIVNKHGQQSQQNTWSTIKKHIQYHRKTWSAIIKKTWSSIVKQHSENHQNTWSGNVFNIDGRESQKHMVNHHQTT